MAKHNRYDFLTFSQNRGKTIDDSKNGWYKNDAAIKLYSIEEISNMLGISRSATYGLLNSGNLPAIKLGTRTMVKMADLVAFVEGRERYKGCLNEI